MSHMRVSKTPYWPRQSPATPKNILMRSLDDPLNSVAILLKSCRLKCRERWMDTNYMLTRTRRRLRNGERDHSWSSISPVLRIVQPDYTLLNTLRWAFFYSRTVIEYYPSGQRLHARIIFGNSFIDNTHIFWIDRLQGPLALCFHPLSSMLLSLFITSTDNHFILFFVLIFY